MHIVMPHSSKFKQLKQPLKTLTVNLIFRLCTGAKGTDFLRNSLRFFQAKRHQSVVVVFPIFMEIATEVL